MSRRFLLPYCPAGCQLEARPAAPFSFRTALHPLACGAGLPAGPDCPLGRTARWAVLRRGRRPAREPAAPRASLGASTRCPARPRRHPRAPQPGPPNPPHQLGRVADVRLCVGSKHHQAPPPPAGSAAWPSSPSGALHTSGPGRGMVLSPDCISAISHAIPLSVFQVLKSNR